FKNALVQNIAGGNTMVFNAEAMDFLRKSKGLDVVAHDWWAYMMISGVGGKVVYDKNPSLLYRQHDRNLMGSNANFISKLNRLQFFLIGEYRKWNQINIDALSHFEDLLTEGNRLIYRDFNKSRDGKLMDRMRYLFSSGVYRQGFGD